MPSKSKKQQRFMGMVYHCKETGDCASKEVEETADNIKKKDVKDFAETKHKGLPEKVKPKKKKRRKKKRRKTKKKRSSDMISKLIRLANSLDSKALWKEADTIDEVIFSNAESSHHDGEDIELGIEEEVAELKDEIRAILDKHEVDVSSELALDLIAWCEKHEHEEMRDGEESEEVMEAEEEILGIT